MAQQKKMVEAITSRDVDFAKWYTDIVKKAELVDYSGVKGCMVIRPYGYAIWENIQKDMDRRFKRTGHENVYMPMFIPESLLQKEKDHVAGFAPECAWVTMGGSEKLAVIVTACKGNKRASYAVFETFSVLPCHAFITPSETSFAVFLYPSHRNAQVKTLVIEKPYRLRLRTFRNGKHLRKTKNIFAFLFIPDVRKFGSTLSFKVFQVSFAG